MKKLIILLIMAALIFGIYNYSYQKAVSKSGQGGADDVVFEIKPGESVVQVADRLLAADLISSSFYYRQYLKKNDLGEKIQAGTYRLNPMLSIKEIAEVLVRGDAVSKESEIKIIEGWNINDIDQYLLDKKIVADSEYKKMVESEIGNWKLSFAKPTFLADAPVDATLEGFLFPDTYRIFNDATAEDIIKKQLDNFGNKLTAEMQADIKKQGKSVYEIITMASIIEREVQSEADMKMVSGIFWNRINNNHALESCATLAYILGERKEIYSLEDTNIDSPYNTYRNLGLPPGPIANPGLQAIKAAIYPTENEYFYFLNRLDTGATIFSRTYDEHLRNKEKYLK